MEPSPERGPRRFEISEARDRFCELADRVAAGEEVIITRHGQPVARLVPETPEGVDALAVDAIFEELRKLSKGFAPGVTREELRGYMQEGRR
ncbi:MAG TPA: type II toxin-antitoxin system prevent-host-death family antitoxin [Planctomycetota bacterium]|nr:type II toxin-antitoxin system prevent-host-death family antitoxin [Planctomycetota bacterium]